MAVTRTSLRSWFFPGAVLLLAAVLLNSDILPISSQAVDFCYYTVFGAGVLLALRFRSTRVFFVLLTLVLAHHAVEFFSGAKIPTIGPGRIAFETVALLIPVNFIAFSIAGERGFSVPSLAPRLCLLFLEAVFVAVICGPGAMASPAFIRATLLDPHLFSWTKIPQPALLAFFLALGSLLPEFSRTHKALEHGMIWSLAASALGLHAGALGLRGDAYFTTAGLILVVSLIENSYFLAYHDELTSLPGRRAFNEFLLGLEPPYVMAEVDIDHFKKVNDTYGHDTGDQVLSMVAAHLARVTSGRAYRVGGEEFSIVCSGKILQEVWPELENLRVAISQSSFRVRATRERRQNVRGPDRRRETDGGRPKPRRTVSSEAGQLSVTISIGVAEPNGRYRDVEQVIQAADKALYRAKRGGRNRIEIATPQKRAFTRAVASRN